MEINDITGTIIDAAMQVHTALGPGLLESAYRTCLAYELRTRGLKVREEHPLPVLYKEIRLDAGYRIDLLVEEAVDKPQRGATHLTQDCLSSVPHC